MTKQVGGTHYATASGTEHWDLFGPEYLMGYATKYMRWRKKGGVEDLRKARSITEKLRKWFLDNHVPRSEIGLRHVADRDTVQAWCREYGLDFVETLVVLKITHWQSSHDLDDAIAGLDYLIENAPTLGSIDVSGVLTIEQVTEKARDHILRRSGRVGMSDGSFEIRDGGIVGTGYVYTCPATPEDGGQHESLWPWFLSRRYVEEEILDDRWALMQPFYRVLGTDRNYVLEPTVESVGMPRELSGVYRRESGNTWIICISQAPESLRDYFPALRRELNAMEYSMTPGWQQTLYDEFNPSTNKYVILDKNAAWAAE